MKSFKIVHPNRFFVMEVTDSMTGVVEQVPLYAYMTYHAAKGQYAAFQDAGVKLMIVPIYAGDRGINPWSATRPIRPGFMTAPNQYDFSSVDEDLRIATCGKAPGAVYVIFRVMLEMPLWWEEMHPEARFLDASGTPLHCSFSSPEWMDACEEALKRLHTWLEESGWSDYVAGYHLAAGSTEEFIRPGLHDYQLGDYSTCSREHFRRWIAEKYIDIDTLNVAWNTAYESFNNVDIPTPIQRKYSKVGTFRDPKTEKPIIDYNRFISEEVVIFATELATRAKRLCDGKKLIGAFYGYLITTDSRNGHNAVNKLYSCDDIDFLAGPICYTASRNISFDWPFQGAVESAALHGKPWFNEADIRTCLTRSLRESMPFVSPEVNTCYDNSPTWFGPETLDLSISQLKRVYARVLTHCSSIWWFDMWGGWYDDPAMMEFHRFAQQDFEKHVFASSDEHSPKLHAELAVFFDKSVADGIVDGFAHELMAVQLDKLTGLGAPYDTYDISDFAAVNPAQYRMALILSPTVPLDKQALARWRTNGKTLFFVGLPGYFAGGNVGTDTEIDSALLEGTACPKATWKNISFPSNPQITPHVVLNPGEKDLVIAQDEEGAPMVVAHLGDGYQTIWSLPIQPPTALIREQLALAGGHIYAHSNDTVYADGDIVTMLAANDGEKRIHFPFAGEAYDYFTGEKLPGTELLAEFILKKGETKMLRIHKGICNKK